MSRLCWAFVIFLVTVISKGSKLLEKIWPELLKTKSLQKKYKSLCIFLIGLSFITLLTKSQRRNWCYQPIALVVISEVFSFECFRRRFTFLSLSIFKICSDRLFINSFFFYLRNLCSLYSLEKKSRLLKCFWKITNSALELLLSNFLS